VSIERKNVEALIDNSVAVLPRRLREAKAAPSISLSDFKAYMPVHRYIFIPTRDLWPAASVDARLPWPIGPKGKPIKPSKYLDKNAPVEQMTWAPGMPKFIADRLIDAGGWIEREGCTTFNLYRPPTVKPGDARDVVPWLRHVRRVYRRHANYIIRWLAHRVQDPEVKINHALVLGGRQGIGKDTILEPVKYAVGPWNFVEVSPPALLGRFNGFVKSVILRVSEARDLGDVDRFAFYEHMKVYTAAPPDVLRCDEKNLREHDVPNVCGVIITTNYKSNGIYLPADDRRHYVAWSDSEKEDFSEAYWRGIWDWYADGGIENVAAYLARLDLAGFDPKAPPPKTDAFWHIVDAARSPEEAELADVLDSLGNPEAVTLDMLKQNAKIRDEELAAWLSDRRHRRQIPHRLEAVGYEPVRNEARKDGLWVIQDRRQAVYARTALSIRDRITAAAALANR